MRKLGEERRHLTVLGSTSLAAILVATPAWAQGTSSQTAPVSGAVAAESQATTSSDNIALEEIIVTAQKRDENIRDVPISISSLSSDALARSGVTNNLQLTNSVPGLRMERVGNATIPAIRGVTTFVTVAGAQANVATYVDNVYISNLAAGTFDLPDVSRVDVLKGPQGTLFGRNATGGAIQVFTRDPNLDRLGGEVSVGYGNFDTFTMKGFITTPIIEDKLAISVSGFRETADNYFENLVPDVPLQNIKNYLVRGKILFTPTSDTRIVLNAFKSRHLGAETVQFFPRNDVTAANAYPGAIVPKKPYQVASNVRQTEDVKAKGVSLQINQNTSAGDFTIIGSWDESSSLTTSPAFAGAIPGFNGVNFFSGVYDESWSAEANFASRKFGRFSFVAGANYYFNNNGWDPTVSRTDLPGTSSDVTLFGKQKTHAYAFYGEATLEATDDLSIIGGLRYSSEKRNLKGSILPGVVSQEDGLRYDWGSRTFNSVTQRASIRYKVNPNSNLYFTYSTGFKSGNLDNTTIPFAQSPESCAAANATVPGSCSFPTSVEPEKITAFELGLKSAISSRVNVDFAIFYNKLKDMQILTFQDACFVAPCPPNPTTSLGRLSNAAQGKMYGAELTLDARLSRELRVTGAISVLDATFSSYPNATWNVYNGTNTSLDTTPVMSATGKQMPRAPKATASLSATYTKELDLGTFSFTANGYASERIFYDVGNVFDQKAYATLGLSASFSPAAVPGLTLTGWGTNITSTRVMLANFYNNSGANESYQRPATYGLRVGYSF